MFVLAAVSARAESAACPPPTAVPATEAAREAALRALEVLAGRCAENAEWHGQRGALLLALGRAAEAAESLERAILLAPGHAGARLDYADALAQLGDTDSARALAEELLAYPDVPPAARRHLQARVAAWRQAAAVWQTRTEVGAHLGWESNLNGGPAADSIWLTLPDGIVNLPLAASERPGEGFAALYEAGVSALRPLAGEWRLLLRGQARLRDAAGARTDYLLGQFDASVLRDRGPGALMLQLGQLQQHFGGMRLLDETRFLAQYQWLAPSCRPHVAGDYVVRHFPAAPMLDGTQLGLRLGGRCGDGGWHADAELRLAIDEPQRSGRPGGRQTWSELRVGAGWQGGLYAAHVETSLGAVRDAAGYSPLLDDNRVRHVRRYAIRMELTRALGPRSELVAGIDHFRQRASLTLFELDNLGLYFGARYRY